MLRGLGFGLGLFDEERDFAATGVDEPVRNLV